MLKWFKRRGAPSAGPDFHHIDSREKAEALFRRGELTKVLLLPAAFGGEDVAFNVVYVPAFAAELKARLDQNTIMSLAQKGHITEYTATPEYEGNSVIPTLIRVSATNPGRFEGSIAIWGKTVQREAAVVTSEGISEQPHFSPSQKPLEDVGPEDVVLRFIEDYERWNNYAFQLSDNRSAEAMAAAESAYSALIGKYCESGYKHQPLAFGSDSNHDCKRESIVGSESTADTCIVRTKRTKVIGKSSSQDDYEYHLKKGGRRWYLTSVLYVDRTGKYEGL